VEDEMTGPVEMLGVSFGAETRFEGRIADEIDKLEQAGLIQVLDFMFLKKDADTGELIRVDYEGNGLVTRLIEGEGPLLGGGACRLTTEDIREVAEALEPGAAAAFMVFEHTALRGLHEAVAEVGGTPFVEGFLTPEAVA
jgi:hypothetical protein